MVVESSCSRKPHAQACRRSRNYEQQDVKYSDPGDGNDEIVAPRRLGRRRVACVRLVEGDP